VRVRDIVRSADARRFSLIVFDWDGTLANSTAVIASAIQRACADVGQPVPNEALARYVIGLGFADAVRHVAPDLPREDYARLAAAYRDNYRAREFEISLFDGVRDLLEELRTTGYRLAIATGKSRTGLERALVQGGLDGMFDATRCADEATPKPHPEMLVYLMSALETAPARTLMIGDTTHDRDFAQNAGASALVVAYGAHDRDALANRGPIDTVNSVSQLRQWLRINA
jgi:phosphoglycolate phosphatase